jgi:hypothetical protein
VIFPSTWPSKWFLSELFYQKAMPARKFSKKNLPKFGSEEKKRVPTEISASTSITSFYLAIISFMIVATTTSSALRG